MEMPVSGDLAQHRPRTKRFDLLLRSAQLLAGSVILGQILFLTFIVSYYYPPTLSGDFAAWNGKPLITGYLAGDTIGNLGFAVHVGFAALLTGSGMVQLLPIVRRRAPHVHRWSGRVFIGSAVILALGGLALVWLRGTYLNLPGALGISFNAITILVCLGFAWMLARRRDFAAHRRWALRLFAVASAVWFMRVAYMAWGIATGGAGIGDAMDGPFDYFLVFGNTLLPLLVIEVFLRAEASKHRGARAATAAVMLLAALAVLGGSAGAWLVMWSPYL